MTDTHTPKWKIVENPDTGTGANAISIYEENEDDPRRGYIADVYRGYVGSQDVDKDEQLAYANLIVRLANLYFAGTASAEQRAADVIAKGDISADPDYGLTENEIAACRMMNALMDENAELLEALETIMHMHDGNMPDALAGMNDVDYARQTIGSMHKEARAAVKKAKGDS